MNYTKVFGVGFIFFLLGLFGASVYGQEVSPKSLFNQANQQYWNGRYNQAESSYRKIVNRFSGQPIYWNARLGLAKSLYKQEKLEPARKHLRAVWRNHPKKSVRAEVLFSMAEVAISMNRTAQATQLLKTFLNLFADHVLVPTVRKQLKLLKKAKGASPPRRTTRMGSNTNRDETADEAPQNPRLKAPDTAARKWQSIINPLKSYETGSTEDKNYKQATASGNSPAKDNLSKTKSPTPNPKRINPLWDKTQPLTSGDRVSSETNQKTSSRKNGKRTKSDKSYNSRKNISVKGKAESPPKDTSAVSSGKKSESETAASDREIDYALNDKDRTLVLNQSRKLYEKGQYEEAKWLIDSILILDSSVPGPYLLASKIYRKGSGSEKKVLSYLNKAIKLAGEPSAAMLLMKSDVLVDRGRFQEARTVLKRLNPSDLSESKQQSRYHYLRGKIALELNNDDEAFFYFMDAVRASSSQWAKRAQSAIHEKL